MWRHDTHYFSPEYKLSFISSALYGNSGGAAASSSSSFGVNPAINVIRLQRKQNSICSISKTLTTCAYNAYVYIYLSLSLYLPHPHPPAYLRRYGFNCFLSPGIMKLFGAFTFRFSAALKTKLVGIIGIGFFVGSE